MSVGPIEALKRRTEVRESARASRARIETQRGKEKVRSGALLDMSATVSTESQEAETVRQNRGKGDHSAAKGKGIGSMTKEHHFARINVISYISPRPKVELIQPCLSRERSGGMGRGSTL